MQTDKEPDESIRKASPAFEFSGKVPFLSSIKVKTWIGIFLVTIVPLGILAFYSFGIMTRITKDLLIKSNIQAFQQVKNEVDRYIGQHEDLMNLLALDSRISCVQNEKVLLSDIPAEDALSHMDRCYEFIQGVMICNPSGEVLLRSRQDGGDDDTLSVSEKLALQSKKNIMFSPGLFHLKKSLGTEENSPVLLMNISFRKLRKILEGMAVGTSFKFFLVTREGENILEQPEFPGELIQNLVTRPFGGYEISRLKSGLPSQVGIILPILRYGLKVVVVQDAAEVFAVVAKIKHSIYIVIIIVGIIAFTLGTAFSIRITKPIIHIAEKANQFSRGNLRVNVRAESSDEIGFLASCFNKMTTKIRKKVFELSAMYRISQLINNAATYQGALDDALAHLVTIFTAKRGSIMLLGDDDSKLKLKSVRQFGEIDGQSTIEVKENIMLDFGEGIAGLVLKSGEPILCLDCITDDRFKPYDPEIEIETPKTLLCVPLVVQGTVVGVINLADRSVSSPFTDDDRELMMTISNQMAMSIENARLHELAITDGLTKLFIHRFFQVKLEDEIKRSKRYQTPLSLILFDIDHFKNFNDQYGHQQGDTVLRELAKIIKNSIRGSDIPCRYGGEEFAVILAHTVPEQAFLFAERMRKAVESHLFPGQLEPLHVTISLGVSGFPSMASDKVEMIRKADVALYHCKARGRNCTSIWNEHM